MTANSNPTPAMFAKKAGSPAYRVFTVADGYDGLAVTDGAKVEEVVIKATGTTIPAVIIGEEGRGRIRAVLPCPAVPAGERLMTASVGASQSGKSRLNRATGAPSDEAAILVLRTPMGFRGGNSHTGEPVGWKCRCAATGDGVTPDNCPQCGASRTGYYGPRREFAPFPGEVLARGAIAEGIAGRMGSGEHLVALVKKDVVFRIRIFNDGRRAARVYYGYWDGQKVILMTAEERELLQDAEAAVETPTAPLAVAPPTREDDGLELLREQLRAWRAAIAKEHRNFRNAPATSRVRDQVAAALRGGGEMALKAAYAAVEALPNHFAKSELTRSNFASPELVGLATPPAQPDEALERELKGLPPEEVIAASEEPASAADLAMLLNRKW